MNSYDAIVVLAGALVYRDGECHSTDLTEADDAWGAPGAVQRVLASAILSAEHPAAVVVASGGQGYDISPRIPMPRPSLAEVLQRELVTAGVPADRILLEDRSNTTHQQLIELARMQTERGWKRMALVTSRWHVPRTEALVEYSGVEFSGDVDVVDAETILIAHDPKRWERFVSEAYASPYVHRRIEREQVGIARIQDGTYAYK